MVPPTHTLYCTNTHRMCAHTHTHTHTHTVLHTHAQDALRKVVKGVGGLDHTEWRAFSNERRTAEGPRGFVDGDLIETFLDLGAEDAQKVGRRKKNNKKKNNKRLK